MAVLFPVNDQCFHSGFPTSVIALVYLGMDAKLPPLSSIAFKLYRKAKTAMLDGRLLKDAQAALRILKFRLAHADCWR